MVSTRSPPPPHLPSGPADKLADNYYVSRDHRRSVAPPIVVSSHRRLREGDSEQLSRYLVTTSLLSRVTELITSKPPKKVT